MQKDTWHLVLVVDDDPLVLATLRALLEVPGVEVAGACNAEAALALLGDGLVPDVILTDLSMPGRTGQDLADAVRAQPRYLGTAIVAMSGCSRSLAALRSSADARLLKPFERPDLLRALADGWAARPLAR